MQPPEWKVGALGGATGRGSGLAWSLGAGAARGGRWRAGTARGSGADLSPSPPPPQPVPASARDVARVPPVGGAAEAPWARCWGSGWGALPPRGIPGVQGGRPMQKDGEGKAQGAATTPTVLRARRSHPSGGRVRRADLLR